VQIAHFKNYRTFNKKSYAGLRENGRVGVQPSIIIILKKRLVSLGERVIKNNNKEVKIITNDLS